MKITGIIPSRFASTRFPGKPLVLIGGKTMIQRVYEQASKSKLLSKVIVATDDERIWNEVKKFGGQVMMTSAEHLNGTERCAEVASLIDADVVINIQGDEPFIHPDDIDLVAACFKNPQVHIATLITRFTNEGDIENPARVKALVHADMDAVNFTRKAPQNALVRSNTYLHLGIYGFKKSVLLELIKLKSTISERKENLEQLRWLENDYSIKCAVTEHQSISIDTPEDLIALEKSGLIK